jgi:hypothetical protein
MVGELGDDRARVAGGGGREPPGEIVRLAPRVDEHDGVQPRLGRHRRDQALGQLDERLVQVARVRVQGARLADNRLGHARVTVTDDGDVVVGVEVPPAVRVEEPNALAAHEMDGIAVRQPGQRRAEDASAPRDQLLPGDRRAPRAELARDGVVAGRVEVLE